MNGNSCIIMREFFCPICFCYADERIIPSVPFIEEITGKGLSNPSADRFICKSVGNFYCDERALTFDGFNTGQLSSFQKFKHSAATCRDITHLVGKS